MSHKIFILYACAITISLLGLGVLYSFGGDQDVFLRQVMWLCVSVGLSIGISKLPLEFLKKNTVMIILYGIGIGLLVLVLLIGTRVKGSQSWINFGVLSFQPSDVVKLFFILLLGKYLSRRHVEIAHPKHIIITGIYLAIPLGLIMMQPDFGSGVVLMCIWFGMLLVSGISKKHLLVMTGIGVLAIAFLWSFVFKPYQKSRIINFFAPTADIRGSGYNVYQSMIAVGSGEIVGRGYGMGTQSRLSFLPEYKTDFIFAAYAEEWGFVGSILLFTLLATLLMIMVSIAAHSPGNFESLCTVGIVIFLVSHMMVNIGMNIGIMPVTGIPLPFMSYGGSHLLVEFMSLGIITHFYQSRRSVHRDKLGSEFDSLQ